MKNEKRVKTQTELIGDLEICLRHFPEMFKEKTLHDVKLLEEGYREKHVVKFLDKLITKNNTIYEKNVLFFEKLFFLLKEEKNRKKYSKILFDKYLFLLDKEPRVYIKKIKKLLSGFGLLLIDLPKKQHERILVKLRRQTIIPYFLEVFNFKKSRK